MKRFYSFLLLTALLSAACSKKPAAKRTVIAIPVYGQSLALGEEAVRVTDFEAFAKKTRHGVVTENLDEEFGFLSDSPFKQWMKKVLRDRHRAFELSVYGMAEAVNEYLNKKGQGDSVIICTFPGGRGSTSIVDLGKGTAPYNKFLNELKGAFDQAKKNGWDFVVPAFCWMQGEDDIVWKKSSNYKGDLQKFQRDLNNDIKAITNQTSDVSCISYQTNCLTLSKTFNPRAYDSKEVSVPQGQLELIRDNPSFLASGPTYPYSFVGERVHIDGVSQKRLGYLAGLSVIRLLESKPSKGLVPEDFTISGDTVLVRFNIPAPPLVFDTLAISKASDYGFTVISNKNINILKKVYLKAGLVKLYCSSSPRNCKVRYAVNGLPEKSGYQNGPRGNLRDSQGDSLKTSILNKTYPLHNWCYQFSVLVN